MTSWTSGKVSISKNLLAPVDAEGKNIQYVENLWTSVLAGSIWIQVEI